MLGRFSLLSIGLWALFLLAIRIAVIPPESCGDTSITAIDMAARGAIDWIRENQQPDGTYLYVYRSGTDTVPEDYNDVRHAGVTMALYQAAGRYGDQQLLASADLGLDWMLARTVSRNEWTALAPDGHRAKLGAAALMAVALAERRLATGDERHDSLLRELGRFMLALQRDDGGFHAFWLLDADGPEYGTSSRYYPGEASWALALLAKAFPEEDWGAAASRALQFLTTKRDDVEDVDFPPLADQWAAYTLAEVQTPLNDDQIAYARRLAGRFGLLVRTESQRQDGWLGKLVRGRESRAAGAGTWVEGLAALWRLSARDERLSGVRDDIEGRLSCAAGILSERQISSEEAMAFAKPQRVRGAWIRGDETRMDDQQHAFSGLLYTGDAMRGRVQREPRAPLAMAAP